MDFLLEATCGQSDKQYNCLSCFHYTNNCEIHPEDVRNFICLNYSKIKPFDRLTMRVNSET